jgi:hypothetical protein
MWCQKLNMVARVNPLFVTVFKYHIVFGALFDTNKSSQFDCFYLKIEGCAKQ